MDPARHYIAYIFCKYWFTPVSICPSSSSVYTNKHHMLAGRGEAGCGSLFGYCRCHGTRFEWKSTLSHTHSILPMKDTICTARLGYIWWQFRFRGYHEPCHCIQTRIQTPTKKNGIGNSLICDHLYDFILFHTYTWLSQKMVCMKKNASWFFHNLSCFFFCSIFLLTTDDVCVCTVEGFECWFIIISRDSSPLNEKLWMCNFYSHPFRMQLIFIFVLELLMVLSPHQIFDFFFFRSPNNPYLWWQIENEHFINNVKSFLLIIQFFYH